LSQGNNVKTGTRVIVSGCEYQAANAFGVLQSKRYRDSAPP
jgi:hypothetical protein